MMYKIILVLSLIIVYANTAEAAWNRTSKSGSCGNGCTYVIDDDNNLTITGSGSSASISQSFFSGVDGFAPYEPYNSDSYINAMTSFNNVTINGINSFGSAALNHLRIRGDLTITGTQSLGYTAITTSLIEGNVYLPDGISIGTSSFWGVQCDGNFVVPDDATFSGTTSFRTTKFGGTLVMTAAQCTSSYGKSALAYWPRLGDEGKIYIKGTEAEVQSCKNAISNNFQEGDKTTLLANIQRCSGDCGTEVCGEGYSLSSGHCVLPCPANCASCNSNGCTQCNSNYLVKAGECISVEDCNNGFHATDAGACEANSDPNCNTEVGGQCTECLANYLTNSSGGCISVEDCNNGFHATDAGACEANSDPNCNTEVGGQCSECNNGYLEQGGNCVESCGVGYKQFENFCNRIQYTPAEAAAVLTNDNNNSVTITFKK